MSRIALFLALCGIVAAPSGSCAGSCGGWSVRDYFRLSQKIAFRRRWRAAWHRARPSRHARSRNELRLQSGVHGTFENGGSSP